MQVLKQNFAVVENLKLYTYLTAISEKWVAIKVVDSLTAVALKQLRFASEVPLFHPHQE